MALRVVEIQVTPNPNAIKVILDQPVSRESTSFLHPSAAEGNPLAMQLFAIPGVSGLLLLDDFITINKSSNAHWADITSRVRQVLGKH
jgi:hypothetical protein